MKLSTRSFKNIALVGFFVSALTGCGNASDLLRSGKDDTESSETRLSASDDSQNLLDDTINAASGLKDPQFKPFRLDGLDGRPGEGPRGPREGGPHGHAKGPHGKDGRGHPHPPMPPLPADILALFKAADAKKDLVLGIDRTKVEPILKALQTDLEALRAVSGTREAFLEKAKEIHAKYAEQLKAVLPSLESLTQEQKDRVKAIHDLQKKVIESCVIRGADPASAACSTAKSELQANIDAP